MPEKVIKKIIDPEELNHEWDSMCECYFQKREFLVFLHKYNPCDQRYYELYNDGKFVAGTTVYTIKMDILTFSRFSGKLNVQVIGIPISVAAPPMIGDENEFENFISELLKIESGIILGLNFLRDYQQNKVVNVRTLPTIILDLNSNDIDEYHNSLRHDYRRRLKRIRKMFVNVNSITSGCFEFSREHYELYLQIMKKTKTKLEIISYELFKNLPPKFRLTTYYSNDQMLCWHIICEDEKILFFFFGGMNYKFRDRFQSYNNNIHGIIKDAFELNYRTIDFGQTAETAKTRLGGELSERRMFFYHKNKFALFLLRSMKYLMSYTGKTKHPRVFKDEQIIYNNTEKLYENTLRQA